MKATPREGGNRSLDATVDAPPHKDDATRRDGKPDAARIAQMLGSIAKIGADPEGGISRLAFTKAEREAHELVGGWLRDLGLTVRRDAVGNTIGELAGRRSDLPAVGVGSHLDSVPRGGRFDGIAGVVAAVEVARILSDGPPVDHPLRVVCFAAEEGARFGEPCLGSRAVVGMLERRDLNQLLDVEGVSVASAMAGVGLEPARLAEARWDAADWAGFLELHVEQGRVLQATDSDIGLVDVVSGSTRLMITVVGQSDHSGGTPMRLRADALAATAEIVLACEKLALDERHRGMRTTVGYLRVLPNSITTIPGRVTFTVDIRDIDTDRQRHAAAEAVSRGRQICERRGVSLDARVIADTSPAVLPRWIREITSASCRALDIEPLVLSSGAGHDAQVINRLVPSGMVFVPSRDGMSHVPEEWTSSADIARGADVLATAVVRLNEFLLSAEAPA